jgi:hypothetical protein
MPEAVLAATDTCRSAKQDDGRDEEDPKPAPVTSDAASRKALIHKTKRLFKKKRLPMKYRPVGHVQSLNRTGS